MVWQLLAGVVGGALSSGAQAADARKAREAEQKRIEAQYKYDVETEKFSWKQTERQYKFAKKETKVARENQENNLRYQEATAAKDYAYNLAIRNFEYANQVRAYNQSEKVYGDQRRLNAIASQQALNAESRRYNELIKGMSFEHQDMLVKALQESGAAEARAGQGVTARRLSGASLSQYGRNQAIMAANLISAQRESLANEKQIYADRYQADVAADARRMLKPLLAPTPSKPLPLPRATLLDPLKPERGPKPMKGVNTVRGPSGLSIANNFINSGLNTYLAVGGKF